MSLASNTFSPSSALAAALANESAPSRSSQSPHIAAWSRDASSTHDAATISVHEHDNTNRDGGAEAAELASSFDDMNLPDNVLRGIYSFGFQDPTRIQQRAVVPLSQGRDVIVQAPAGTGKTGTFAIGFLSRIDPALEHPQVLVLSPTRDLAQQTTRVTNALGTYLPVYARDFIGGKSVREDIAALKHGGVQVVCGTPGRVSHLLREDLLPAGTITTVVLDEADVLLSMGFSDAMYNIFQLVPRDVQAVVVSATMPPDAVTMTNKILRNPVRILLAPKDLKLDGIHAYYVDCERPEHKYGVLCDFFEALSVAQTIIFVNRKHTAMRLADQLDADDFTVSLIHGELEQSEREQVLASFRSGASRVLVATDVVARGLDVQQVSLVVNYDMPAIDNYIHRVGRAGRFGRKGAAINLLAQRDVRQKAAIERHYHLMMEELPSDLCIFD